MSLVTCQCGFYSLYCCGCEHLRTMCCLFFPGCMQARMVLKKVKNFRKLMFQLLYCLKSVKINRLLVFNIV